MMRLGAIFLLLSSSGCSVRAFATNSLANAISGTSTVYASDGDPELVREAVPFGLKTMEQILDEQPRHVGLLMALARGFVQYSYAFVQQEADFAEDKEMGRAQRLRLRARKLYLRARDYGLRGLEAAHPGLRAKLIDGKSSLAVTVKEDVPLLYWTGVAWSLAVANGMDEMKLVGDLPTIEAVMARALALDESWGAGAIHEFYVAYDGGRGANEGGGPERARAHLDRALALAQNKKLGPLVSYAEAVSVTRQDRAEFRRLLEQVLAVDLDAVPSERLVNTLAQARARWLLSRVDELFAE